MGAFPCPDDSFDMRDEYVYFLRNHAAAVWMASFTEVMLLAATIFGILPLLQTAIYHVVILEKFLGGLWFLTTALMFTYTISLSILSQSIDPVTEEAWSEGYVAELYLAYTTVYLMSTILGWSANAFILSKRSTRSHGGVSVSLAMILVKCARSHFVQPLLLFLSLLNACSSALSIANLCRAILYIREVDVPAAYLALRIVRAVFMFLAFVFVFIVPDCLPLQPTPS